jgi:hypothetical protein
VVDDDSLSDLLSDPLSDLLSDLVESLDGIGASLEVLRYRLVVLGALAAAEQGPSILTAVREIELAYEELRLHEMVRSSSTLLVADHLGVDPASRLDELASSLTGGWRELLLDRRHSLRAMVAEIQVLADTVSAAMGRRAALADEALAFLHSGPTPTYGRAAARGAVLVDGVL